MEGNEYCTVLSSCWPHNALILPTKSLLLLYILKCVLSCPLYELQVLMMLMEGKMPFSPMKCNTRPGEDQRQHEVADESETTPPPIRFQEEPLSSGVL